MTTSDYTSEIPYGYCQCGCGNKTSIALQNHTKYGWVRGEPLKYIAGHNNRKPYNQRLSEFWTKINKNGTIPTHCPEIGQCWEWIGAKDKEGYGSFSYTNGKQRAHRIMWLLTYGDANNLHVLHECDNPSCVNPKHLFLGTNQDNSDDKINKGRQVKGEKQHKAKLNETQIREIRNRFALGSVSCTKLGREYNVNKTTISSIVRYKTWKHVE